jgi:hypothetical protein
MDRTILQQSHSQKGKEKSQVENQQEQEKWQYFQRTNPKEHEGTAEYELNSLINKVFNSTPRR